MMLVPDASVLNYLDHGGLLESAFSCGLTMVVPDLLYDKDLEKDNGVYLRELGLVVVEITPAEMSKAQAIKEKCTSLSTSDCHALVCACRQNHSLAAGNMNLSREATAHGIKVHNVLWILDHMDVHGHVDPTLLHEGLSKIAGRRRCLLPKDGVQVRLSKWTKKANKS